jgi:hypothetical protein
VTDPTLADLRDALLGGLRTPKPLRRRDETLAYERHQLLVIRFQAVVRLSQTGGAKGRDRWAAYFREHFPRGDEHAILLWTAWRKPLLRNEPPGAGVIVAYGCPDAHWQHVPVGQVAALVVDLESMWEDYERSVESFLDACHGDAERAARALRRWSQRPRALRAPFADAAPARISTFRPASTATSPHRIVYAVTGDVDGMREV